jgi:predicted MFS family arabinose efflux permease
MNLPRPPTPLDASVETLQTGNVAISARSTVVGGIVALAVAMGIGRFAFTPLLPLMLRDGTIDASTGADWAAANYGGYLIGALTASRMGRHMLRNLHAALLGVVVSTVLAAFIQAPLPGATLRFAAGLFSAWVLVLASSWCLANLAHQGASRSGAWIYTGVGIGIALAGALTWLGGMQSAWLLWLELGLLAAAGTTYAMIALPLASGTVPLTSRTGHTGGVRGHLELVICYGTFGFGYIVPATFLPALARQQVDNPLVFGLTWPLFGIAATLSVAIVSRLLSEAPRRRVWAVAQAMMAIGTGLPVFTRGLWSLALSAALVGGTFMITTMAGLQLARELAPHNPTPLLARMTAAFAVGQIAGPVAVRLLSVQSMTGMDGMTLASAIAALLLALTAIWLWHVKPTVT